MKLTRMPRTAGWLAVASLLGAALIAPSGAAATSFQGAIWTSGADGAAVNQNRYAAKSDVYLNGGPQNCGDNGLPDGEYYFQVTNPSGATLLSTDAIKLRQIKVVNGVISGVSGAGDHLVGAGGCVGAMPVQLMPFSDTPNNGDEYSVDMASKADVEACDGFDPDSATFNFVKGCRVASKNDNFKVGETTTTDETTTTTTTTDETTTTTDETTTTTTTDETTTTTTTDETTTDETTTDETTTTTTDETTTNETTTTTTDETTTDETTKGETTTDETTKGETTTDETTTTSTPDGEVRAAVGTPNPTLPSTDTASISGGSTTSGSTWQLLLVAMAGLLASVLLLTPATVARKR